MPYSGKLLQEKSWWKKFFWWRNLHLIAQWCHQKTPAFKFCGKTFANSHKTAKLTKVFSLKSFPPYGIVCTGGQIYRAHPLNTRWSCTKTGQMWVLAGDRSVLRLPYWTKEILTDLCSCFLLPSSSDYSLTYTHTVCIVKTQYCFLKWMRQLSLKQYS